MTQPVFHPDHHNDRTGTWPINRVLVLLALTVFAALLLRNGFAMARFAGIAIDYPLDLDYGEGIIWQQARDIVAGRGYGPFGVYPAIVFHYPPIYHLTSMALARLGGIDELAAGRGVSMLATLVTMGLCARCARTLGRLNGFPPHVWFAAAAVTPFIFISFPPVMMWFAFMRVDMLAGALSLAGLLLSVRALQRPLTIVPASILFVLAIYTKQTSIAAPAAAFLTLACIRLRLALVLLLSCSALGLAALIYLSWITGGGFLQHIVGYNLNRLAIENWLFVPRLVGSNLIVFAAAAAGATMTSRCLFASMAGIDLSGRWRGRLKDDVPTATALALLLFLILKSMMLPLILKSGSSYNYLIEWLEGIAIFAAVGIAPLIAAAVEARPASPALALAALLLPMQLLSPVGWDLTSEMARRRAEHLAPLVAQIRAADKPVLSDEMILLIRAGKPVRWESAITAELAHSGKYDQVAFARLIRNHAFAAVITKAERGAPLFDDRYGAVVAAALDKAYPRRWYVEDLIVRLPPAPESLSELSLSAPSAASLGDTVLIS